MRSIRFIFQEKILPGFTRGELMLGDFDDIDKYLVNASKIFSTVTDLHQIDREFELNEEDLERLRTFWKSFFDRDPSLLRNEFMNTWQHLGKIYTAFCERLASKNLAYEGMVYKEIAGNATQLIKELKFPHIVFAGFYALTPSEFAIIDLLVQSGRASTYWDGDSYYIDDPSQEAGEFFRNNPLTSEKFLWKQNHFAEGQKNIEFAGIPLQVGQARYAGNVLSEFVKNKDFVPEKTVVVLPDEKLLFPVLYSLPPEIESINVTMGYPLSQTPLFNLFELLMILQHNGRTDKKNETSFYFRDVVNVLNHPYIRIIADKQINTWINSLEQHYIRIPLSLIHGQGKEELFKMLFRRVETVEDLFEWYRIILRTILESMKDQSFRFHKIEAEFVYHFFTQLKRVEDILQKTNILQDVNAFWKIFREIILSVKIPFSGEPLKGLQVMGFLETRILDFENVIILSVNEDLLPASSNKPSFIPFNIRKAFGLPTYEENHAISAFHFYRLLQRARNIYILYNTEPKVILTGERSRFLLQIEHELLRRFPEKIQLTQKVISTKIAGGAPEKISVVKNEAVMKELSRFLSRDGNPASSSLSPSALTAYIACPLRFYLRYIAGLNEKEEIEENMEAATFGSVFHKTMQHMYSGVEIVNIDIIGQLKKKVNEIVDQAIHEEFININQLEGKNILLRNIIRELVNRILEAEKTYAPFRIIQLEKDINSYFNIGNNLQVRLKGIIDRVDEKGDIYRVIDYKTGRLEKKKLRDLSEYFTDPAFKEYFQAMYYAFMLHRNMPENKIISALFVMRNLQGGMVYLNNNEPFKAEQFREFENHLIVLLNEIFSSGVPFSQTDDLDRCKYCAYAGICNR